jgi:hypothetical protein
MGIGGLYFLVKGPRSEAITYSQPPLRFRKRRATPPIPHISLVTNQAEALLHILCIQKLIY